MSDAGSINSSVMLETANDSRSLYPFTIHDIGRLGGVRTVFAESAQVRDEWKRKLEEIILLQKMVMDANRVFEIETLSAETFLAPSKHASGKSNLSNDDNVFTGKVTCSVPFCVSYFLPFFLDFSDSSQRPLAAVNSSRSAVLRAFGSDFDTILNVSDNMHV